MALAHFVKRGTSKPVARFAAVTVVRDDDKSEAGLIWLALMALRNVPAEVGVKTRRRGRNAGIS
jgi:hypothetical protein